MGHAMLAHREVIVGVDTHQDVHVAVALDGLGARLGVCSVPSTGDGFAELARWAHRFGEIRCFGIEGTGSFGATLTRYLQSCSLAVVEVDRPDRRMRRSRGKSDPLDAESAARAVLSGAATGSPKRSEGTVEMIRALKVARCSAMKARTQATNSSWPWW